MKIEKKDNTLIVFLNKKIISRINLNNRIEQEKSFQKIFDRLNTIYNLEINGQYEINMYNNEQYGIILEIKQKESEYFDYYDTIDMNIIISKYNDIIYRVENLYKVENTDIYIYNGEIYIEPKNIKFEKLGLIMENSEIIYGKKANIIKKKGKRLNHKNRNLEKII
jgi:hypothetical protein